MKPSAARILQTLLAVALVQACDRDRGPFRPDASLERADVPAREQMAAGTWSPVASMPTARFGLAVVTGKHGDRKSTRLNSSHLVISYAVFCLKKKKNSTNHNPSTV